MGALVIGSGVAGLTAAMWLRRYDAPFSWVSADGAIGGALSTVYNRIIDYPGVRGNNGAEVAAALAQWAIDLSPPTTEHIERIRAVDGGFEVSGSGRERTYKAVLVATGCRQCSLDIPGEAEGVVGGWVLSSTSKDPTGFAGKTVCMIGGGDAAAEGTLNILDAGAREVLLAARSPLRAQRHFVDRLRSDPRVRVVEGELGEVVRLDRADGLCSLTMEGGSLEADLVVVRIGVEPVRPKFDPRPRLDESGFIMVDGRGETDVPGLFAAGDVTSTPLRSIATSVGDGTRAARSIAELLGMWT